MVEPSSDPRIPIAFDGRIPLQGRAHPVGDKSISHRALLLSALGRGVSRVSGANPGQDVVSTARCLRALGVGITQESRGVWRVSGRGRRWRPATEALDCGNSGTTMRLLAGILAGQPFTSTLTGDPSLQARPMARVARPLRELGARVEGPTNGDRAPLVVTGGTLRERRFELEVASAQVKSCLLLAAWVGETAIEVVEPGDSRDHTERMMAARGVDLEFGARKAQLRPGPEWQARDVEVPADPSAAALLAAAAVVVPGSELALEGVLTNPTRTGFVEVLRRMGVDVSWSDRRSSDGEERGTLGLRAPARVQPTLVVAEEIPRLVDEVPALAVVAALGDGPTVFEGVGELRVKETDRITALEELLGAFDVRTESGSERLVVHGGTLRRPRTPLPATADHRIAMCGAALALAVGAVDGQGPLTVDLSAAGVSDPDFAGRIRSLQGGEGSGSDASGTRGERG